MKHLRFLMIALLVGLSAQPAGAGDPPGVDPLIAQRIIARLPAGASIKAFVNTINSDFPGLNASPIDALPSRNLYLLQHAPISGATLNALDDRLNDIYPAQGTLVYGELMYEGKAP